MSITWHEVLAMTFIGDGCVVVTVVMMNELSVHIHEIKNKNLPVVLSEWG